MMSVTLATTLLSVLSLHTLAAAQTCDGTTISEVIFSDITQTNSAFTSAIDISNNVIIDGTGTILTTTAQSSFGGFFFGTPTSFQGPGGFSLKFVLKSTDTSLGTGDAWEFIVANSSNLALLPPPYAPGSANAGLSGWSRQSAFVVEFDAMNSGADEQDQSANHVAVYLDGTERCSTDLSVNLADGANYTVWLDYIGFNTQSEIRISAPNDVARPAAATLNCDVDIWSTMDITTSNHVGFMAYNPTTGPGAEHSMVETLSLADAYRPYDAESCAAYANCVQKTVDSLAISEPVNGLCRLAAADASYVWDVSGTECCAFVEKASWTISASAGSGPFAAGDNVPCEQVRKTIVYLVTADMCA